MGNEYRLSGPFKEDANSVGLPDFSGLPNLLQIQSINLKTGSTAGSLTRAFYSVWKPNQQTASPKVPRRHANSGLSIQLKMIQAAPALRGADSCSWRAAISSLSAFGETLPVVAAA